ncbi:859_t:CDS:1, partial [Ambispora leptoticha]
AAYADELSIGIGFPLDWSNLLEIFIQYEKASNTKINKAKSTLISLTNNVQRVELADQFGFKLLNENQNTFTILGYTVDLKGSPDKTLWSNITKKIKDKI